MDNFFHEFRYILHLEDYDSGVFFYREVLGLQPNYNWAIIPDNKGYRFYLGTGKLEIVKYPFTPSTGKGEFWVECGNLDLCLKRIKKEMKNAQILSQTTLQAEIQDMNGNKIRLVQSYKDANTSPTIEKTNMFTGMFTGILYEDDLQEACDFYTKGLRIPLLQQDENEAILQVGDSHLLLKKRKSKEGPSSIGIEAKSVNIMYDYLKNQNYYHEICMLHDTDFDARRLFQFYDPGKNVVEVYAYLRNIREEILMH